MGVGEVGVAAATAVVGYDLMKDTKFQRSSRPRALTGFALKGSAAGGDTKVELFIGNVYIAEFYNKDVGLPNMDDVQPMDMNYVPPAEDIHVYVTDAPSTNPIYARIVWRDLR